MEVTLDLGDTKQGILLEPQTPDEIEFLQSLTDIFNRGGDVTVVTKDGKEITHGFKPLRPALKVYHDE